MGRTLGGARGRAQVQEVLSEAADHWCKWGFGRWLLQAGEEPVGTVKLARCEIAGLPEVELGYALCPEFWGAGYATEAASGALDFGRDAAGLTDRASEPDRQGSRSLLSHSCRTRPPSQSCKDSASATSWTWNCQPVRTGCTDSPSIPRSRLCGQPHRSTIADRSVIDRQWQKIKPHVVEVSSHSAMTDVVTGSRGGGVDRGGDGRVAPAATPSP